MLENKVALVTGAGRGIGRAIAIALAEEGAEVIVNYNGSEERAKEVKQTIEENGGKASIYKCNVSDFEACETMIREIVKEHGYSGQQCRDYKRRADHENERRRF